MGTSPVNQQVKQQQKIKTWTGFRSYLPGESPFSSNKIPSPDTPVKLVFIRKSSSLAPSIGRMASQRPLKYMKLV